MTCRRGVVAIALCILARATAVAATATICARLGDRLLERPDSDAFTIAGRVGEDVHAVLAARAGATAHGTLARLMAVRAGGGGARRSQGVLPLAVDSKVPRGGLIESRVRELRRDAAAFVGSYGVTVP